MYVISFVCVSVIQFEPNNLGRVIQIKPYSFMSCKLNSELLNLFQFKSLSLSHNTRLKVWIEKDLKI